MFRALTVVYFVSAVNADTAFDVPGAHGCDARATWQEMLTAKGGEARLKEIRSLYVAEVLRRWDWENFRLSSYDIRQLYEFPTFGWLRYSQPGTLFGTSVAVIDIDRDVALAAHTFRPGIERAEDVKDALTVAQALYLFQTDWFRPNEMSCSLEQVEGRLNRVLRVDVGQKRFVYYLKGKEALPWQIIGPGGDSSAKHRFGDYKSTGGLKLPAKHQRFTGHHWYEMSATYEVNPRIDREFRLRQPSLSADPDAWRVPR